MKYIGRIICSVGALLSSACVHMPTEVAQTVTDSLFCEIIYSPIPHLTSGQTTGEELLGKVLNLSEEKQRKYFQDVIPITESLIQSLSVNYDTPITVQDHYLITGGYEGKTSPSISAGIVLEKSESTDLITAIASAIGHAYIQDSVIIQCPDDGKVTGSEKANFILTDSGDQVYLNNRNVRLFYGMMIGVFNDPAETGYSYYPKRSKFVTFDDVGDQADTLSKLKSITEMLKSISNGDIDLNIDVETIDVSFPHNDWKSYPLGDQYFSVLSKQSTKTTLDEHRALFVKIMRRYTQ